MDKKTEDAVFRARQSKEGKKGGKSTLKKHGLKHYSEMAKKRWKKKKVANGTKPK